MALREPGFRMIDQCDCHACLKAPEKAEINQRKAFIVFLKYTDLRQDSLSFFHETDCRRVIKASVVRFGNQIPRHSFRRNQKG